jgi:hypothetical protein
MPALGADDLVVFVSFAGNHNCVAGSCLCQREADCLTPVRLHDLLGRAHSAQDVINDRLR